MATAWHELGRGLRIVRLYLPRRFREAGRARKHWRYVRLTGRVSLDHDDELTVDGYSAKIAYPTYRHTANFDPRY
ncbi:protein of unknown function [Candidatus Filomicrobium marinum]|uniref:Uncharacterized protein n=1 Tax=Candidatus Filomicrobium marinum TaxID=1608628 RepID=A0A0D6J9Q2_9HYPH|nr:protein of unknown function [Candidatus Filomicrobium marinum]CPR15084.1 protein of unknown function [Candidatus Filomicrobium marinum]